MDGSLIYRKTRRGAAELTATHGGHVATAARRVLIMLDGRRTLDELAELFGPEAVEHAIDELEAQGLARLVDPEAGNQTTQQVTQQALISGGEAELHALEPELAPLETKTRRRGLAWIALALPALAIGGGYYIVTGADRPADAARDSAVAVARTAEPARAALVPGPDEQGEAGANPNGEGPKELPLSGLPPVIVKAAATVPAPGRRGADAQVDGATEVVPAAAPEPAPKIVAGANPPAPETAPSRPREAAPAVTKAREAPAPAPAPVAPVAAENAAADGSRAPAAESGRPPIQLAAAAPTPLPAQEAVVTLHPRRQDPPIFPGRALRAKVTEGHVLARIWITPEGKVDQVDIVNATPPRVFDDEVRRALTAWTFDPPGQPVSKTVELMFKP